MCSFGWTFINWRGQSVIPISSSLESHWLFFPQVGLIQSCSRILVLTGAGVSVSCGIPDFRSKDGVYARWNFTSSALGGFSPSYSGLPWISLTCRTLRQCLTSTTSGLEISWKCFCCLGYFSRDTFKKTFPYTYVQWHNLVITLLGEIQDLFSNLHVRSTLASSRPLRVTSLLLRWRAGRNCWGITPRTSTPSSRRLG